MAKKMIAVVPLWDDEKESIWMLPGYMNGIKEADAVPLESKAGFAGKYYGGQLR
ncbi:MAG: hypothetical protein LUE87_10230 [Lachnospiraceae bacterium]|nr:hypothetical protein [Lachnospiraceae bacterium]